MRNSDTGVRSGMSPVSHRTDAPCTPGICQENIGHFPKCVVIDCRWKIEESEAVSRTRHKGGIAPFAVKSLPVIPIVTTMLKIKPMPIVKRVPNLYPPLPLNQGSMTKSLTPAH